MTTLAEKVSLAEANINSRVFEMENEAHALALALLTKNHLFLLGDYGIGKSALLRLTRDLIGISADEYFEYLLTPTTQPEELFGTFSLASIEKDQFKRVTTGRLPEAKLAMLEEIFHISSSCGNTLLRIANERLFENPEPQSVPLATILCSANMVAPSDLGALWDRLLIRLRSTPVSAPSNFIKMLTMEDKPVTQVMTWEEIEQAQDEVAQVSLTMDVAEAVALLRESLKRKGINASPRRWRQSISLAKAEAWLDGRTETTIRDCRPFRWTLWSDPGEINLVERAVLEMASPADSAALELRDGAVQLTNELQKMLADHPVDSREIKQWSVPFHGKILSLEEEIDRLAGAEEGSVILSELMQMTEFLRITFDSEVCQVPISRSRRGK